MARLKENYEKHIRPALLKEFHLKNIACAPKLQKIVINMGVKEGGQDIKIIDQCAVDLTRIAGQRAVITRAKKAISNFKLRKSAPVGVKVTLRRTRMYEFLDRLISIAMPRIKDFQGVPLKSFDQHGNYSLGLTEQLIFPEVNFDSIKKIQGMDIVLVTTAQTKEQAKRLLELLGIPFRRK